MSEPRAVGELRLPARHPLRVVQMVALGVGIAGAIGSVLGWRQNPAAFYHAYLIVFLYLLGFALGPIGILGLQYITGGRWGAAIRRPLEAAASTLPLVALMFVPIVIGMHELYVWTHADVVAKDVVLSAKAGYLNERFFLVRAALYFIVWIAVSWFLCRLSHQQDAEPSEAMDKKLQFMGRGTLVLYALTMTFASVDWAMSIEPHWFSHIYGVRMIGGQILTAFAFAIVITVVLQREEPLTTIIGRERFHDLGNLMLAFVMLWAYFELSQFLIIWSADLPEETSFYIRRLAGEWRIYGLLLVTFHFVVPFLVLLSRPVKHAPMRLGAVALMILVARAADVYWLIDPSYEDPALVPHWLAAALLAGLGGLWLAAYVWRLAAYPLLPVSDTSLLRED
jgi:hypothetical protein